MRRFVLVLPVAVALIFLRIQAINSAALGEANAHKLLSDSILRILILGDSVAAGTGDESGYGIRGRLTERLSNTPSEVTNGGIPGARVRDVLHAIADRKRTGAAIRRHRAFHWR